MTTGQTLLEGVVVVELARFLAGPHAGMMLADLGARVIKVERPGTGDETRGWGPPFVDTPSGHESTYFLSCNRNKESIAVDLKDPAGRETLDRLIQQADVVIENFRPGAIERLGMSIGRMRTLNPRLIVLSITGFGFHGPDRDRAGYDQILQGEAGLMGITGPGTESPTKVGIPIADLAAGMFGAFAVVAALHRRERTGSGCTLQTSLLSSLVGLHSFQGTRVTVAGETPVPTGNDHPSIAPYGMFSCSDSYIQVAVGSEALWRVFAPVVGIDVDDDAFATNSARVRNRTRLRALIESAMREKPVSYWLETLTNHGIPAGHVRTLQEVYEWAHLRDEGLVAKTRHSAIGEIELPGVAIEVDGERPMLRLPPPVLGEHTDEVLRWLDERERGIGKSR